MMGINISFVVIEYRCIDELKRCINSIQAKSNDLTYEIIVSSNSGYSSTEKNSLVRDFQEIKWIFNEDNIGFAKAMNNGIFQSSGKTIVIMNPDAQIVGGNVLTAYQYLMEKEDLGIIGPQIVDNDGKLQDSCRKFMTPLDLLSRMMYRVFLKKDVILNKGFDYSKIQAVDWVIGAFMMVKREALDRVGLLDEYYFLYVEDMDWCKRFWDNGYKVVYYPDLVIQYKGDRKSVIPLMLKGLVIKYTAHHFKSYLRFVRKHGLYFYNNQRV